MITWIQRYFQHHFRTIFAVLLVLIIVSFVFTIGASPGIGRADRRQIDRQFFDYNLSLQDDQKRLMGDASLSANLQMGSFGGLQAEQIQNYAFQRAASLHLADEWHIPRIPLDPKNPTDAEKAEIATVVKSLRMFAGPDGQFDAKAYATFRDNLKTNPRGVSEAEIARVLGDDVRVEKVNKLISGPGYVLPGDIKSQLVRADTTWTIATAAVDYASFAPAIKPTDADLVKSFEENSFRYEVPPRLVASYIDFPSANFISGVKLSDAEVRGYYDANPARFPKPAADPKAPAPVMPKPEDVAADFTAARPQVEAALQLERAQKLAVKAASDFTLALYEGKVAAAGLEGFLAARKLALKPLPPFTREAAPAEIGGSPEIAAEAFKLSAERFYTEALPVPLGAVVIFFKEMQPSRKSLLAEVREKVLADYIENEKRQRFVELGKTLKGQLDTRLKAGDTLEQASATVATAAGVKIEAKAIPAFTLRTRPQDLDYTALGALERLDRGQLSDMSMGQDKGIFVYASDKKAPDVTDANPRYAETKMQLASYGSRMGASAYISELVEKELKKSEPKVE